MPAQIIQMMTFAQISDIWRPGRSMEDHLNTVDGVDVFNNFNRVHAFLYHQSFKYAIESFDSTERIDTIENINSIELVNSNQTDIYISRILNNTLHFCPLKILTRNHIFLCLGI